MIPNGTRPTSLFGYVAQHGVLVPTSVHFVAFVGANIVICIFYSCRNVDSYHDFRGGQSLGR